MIVAIVIFNHVEFVTHHSALSALNRNFDDFFQGFHPWLLHVAPLALELYLDLATRGFTPDFCV